MIRARRLTLSLPPIEPSKGWHILGRWSFTYRAKKVGGSVAHDVTLHTNVGEATCAEPVEPDGQWYNIALPTPSASWRPEDSKSPLHPTIGVVTFTDPGGTKWRQTPGRLPEVAD